ncbi:MAG: TonB-dependent receptor plug domain-containing protein, partial [Verrucomicrobiota bacterium]
MKSSKYTPRYDRAFDPINPRAAKARFSAAVLPLVAAAVCITSQAGAAVAAVAAASPSPTPAPEAAATEPTLLQEVVVTATRTDETADRVTSAFTKIDANEIQRDQFQNVKQAVNLSPGVIAREQGAKGGLTNISIRGNRSVDTL